MDRFVAGPIKQILLLMQRKPVWEKTGLLAERLMKQTCKHYSIHAHALNIGYTRRIRVGGVLTKAQYKHSKNCIIDKKENLELLKPYNLSGHLCKPNIPF